MVLKAAKKIKMLLLDVDGVLTDGKVIYNDQGGEAKSFDIKDGHGLKLLMRCNIDVALITGRKSEALLHRAKDLGITMVYQRILDKIKIYDKILLEKGLTDQEVCYVGDDLVDLPPLRRAGFSVAVADGVDEVREAADYVTQKKGGEGAVREVCELILKAQNRWEEVTRRYFSR